MLKEPTCHLGMDPRREKTSSGRAGGVWEQGGLRESKKEDTQNWEVTRPEGTPAPAAAGLVFW